jgi:subtilisin family serine protease
MPSYNTQALYDAINSTRQAGMLFVAACGNSANNNDVSGTIYPASFNLDNIISVAATTYADELATWSSYGPTTVDLAAPGLAVLSCAWDNDSAYVADSGTSLSAPHVAGACALLWARYPNESYLQIKNRLLNGTDPLSALAGKCVTGGRLNLRKVLEQQGPTAPMLALVRTNGQLQLRLTAGPSQSFVIQSSSNLLSWASIHTNVTSATGVLNFIDPAAGTASRRFYRARSGS